MFFLNIKLLKEKDSLLKAVCFIGVVQDFRSSLLHGCGFYADQLS